MKITHSHPGRVRQAGLVTVLFIALLSIMLILVMAESKALFRLHREVKFLEQKQIQRLHTAATNLTGRAELPPGQPASPGGAQTIHSP